MNGRILLNFATAGLLLAGSSCSSTTTTGGGNGEGGADSATTGDSGGGRDSGMQTDSGGGGDSSGGGCNPACSLGRMCCGGVCVNPANDPLNCGGCNVACMGATPYCAGTCMAAPCDREGGACGAGGSCCGAMCCSAGQLCCLDEGPVPAAEPLCFTPTPQAPTCPPGCAPACVSDRNAKRDFSPVDGREVLDRLASVPMSTWAYKTDPSVRHLGPMAQDLHEAFGLGPSDRSYDPIDAHGIAFASIQALYGMVEEQNARIDKLEKENARLRAVCK